MTESTTTPKLVIAATGVTDRLEVVIGREDSNSRQVYFSVNATLARTNSWNRLKRYGYVESDEYKLFVDEAKSLVDALLGDTEDYGNHAIQSVQFGSDTLLPVIDEKSWHLLPYFANMVLDHLEAAFNKELEVIIVEENFLRLNVNGNEAADARQDRLHLQLLKQAFPDATVVSDLKELERRRLGVAATQPAN